LRPSPIQIDVEYDDQVAEPNQRPDHRQNDRSKPREPNGATRAKEHQYVRTAHSQSCNCETESKLAEQLSKSASQQPLWPKSMGGRVSKCLRHSITLSPIGVTDTSSLRMPAAPKKISAKQHASSSMSIIDMMPMRLPRWIMVANRTTIAWISLSRHDAYRNVQQ
jgi:hypothetical protein